MASIFIISMLIAVSTQVLPVTLGISTKKSLSFAIRNILVIIIIQVLMLWLGIIAGKKFMYLMNDFRSVIIFIGFLLIGIRMIMETFSIRRGDRTCDIEKISQLLLAAFGQSINVFLTGILFYYLDKEISISLIIFTVSVSIISFAGLLIKPERLSLLLASLINLVSAFVVIITGVFFTFFF